jgi:hypothetical protein
MRRPDWAREKGGAHGRTSVMLVTDRDDITRDSLRPSSSVMDADLRRLELHLVEGSFRLYAICRCSQGWGIVNEALSCRISSQAKKKKKHFWWLSVLM